MNRRCLFIIASLTVLLYFATIFIILVPLPLISGFERFTYVPNGGNIFWCKKLQWKKPVTKYSVMLASFPGSGNTWLRYLLQQATGILTGSVYMDHSLRNHGFPAENITDGSVLVVKTHYGVPKNIKIGAAVLLIRNPKEAILAEFNRLHKGHIGTAPRRAFNDKQAKSNWPVHVEMQTRGWMKFHENWLNNFKKPMHVIFYDNLVQNTEDVLIDVLNFLNQTITQQEMDCVMAHKEGIYRRRNKHGNFNPYTKDMENELEVVKNRIYSQLN